MRLYRLVYEGKQYVSHHYNKLAARNNIRRMLIDEYGEERAEEILFNHTIKVRRNIDDISFVAPKGMEIW